MTDERFQSPTEGRRPIRLPQEEAVRLVVVGLLARAVARRLREQAKREQARIPQAKSEDEVRSMVAALVGAAERNLAERDRQQADLDVAAEALAQVEIMACKRPEPLSLRTAFVHGLGDLVDFFPEREEGESGLSSTPRSYRTRLHASLDEDQRTG